MKECKYNKVECQKDAIVADQKTMKHMPLSQVRSEDENQNRQLRDGQSLKFHTPKQ